jgi:predicted TIM-barrel fold metal-dependent hydrolase
MPRVIDAHIHLSNRKDDVLLSFARQNGLEYTLSELLQIMRKNDVESGLLLSPPLRSGAPLPNREVLKLCRSSKGRLFPILTVAASRQSVDTAVHLARKERETVKGFKVLLGYAEVFATDTRYDSLYDYAQAEELPVMFHTGDTATSEGSLVHSHPLTLDPLANRRPDLKIVACHFGNPWIEDVGELIYKHANVYSDISGMAMGGSKYLREYVDQLARRISGAIYYSGGAKKVLFGTDYPVTPHELALDLVQRLDIDESDKRGILGSNAAELFQL